MHNALFSNSSTRQRRALQILLQLVELHLRTGRPVGSQALKEEGVKHLSSATLRNYFAQLESLGYLRQTHISGGRLPTDAAFEVYAHEALISARADVHQGLKAANFEQHLPPPSGSGLSSWIESIAGELSRRTRCCIALTLPRFTQDFVVRVQLVSLLNRRLLSVVCTQFGLVHTTSLSVEWSRDQSALEDLTAYCNWRLNESLPKPPLTSGDEQAYSQIHGEIMIHYLIQHSGLSHQRLALTGLSQLLCHSECREPSVFAEFLTLLEERRSWRRLLNHAQSQPDPLLWVGRGLSPYFPEASHCSVIAGTYRLHRTSVGAIALIGPVRMPYREVFGHLIAAQEHLQRHLTESIYKFNIDVKMRSFHKLSSRGPSGQGSGGDLTALPLRRYQRLGRADLSKSAAHI